MKKCSSIIAMLFCCLSWHHTIIASLVKQRCEEMVHRFDSCIVATFGSNDLGQSPSAYLTENLPLFLDTLSGVNLTHLVQPESPFQQELYLGSNVFRNCHDYNRFENCLDFEFGKCFQAKESSSEIFNLFRQIIRRHGGETWQAVRFTDRQITDITNGMDFLCGRKIGQLEKYRTCLLGVFQQNKALGYDVLELLQATSKGSGWSQRLCDKTQRLLNSLMFAIRRSCENDFKVTGQNATAEVLEVLRKVTQLALEANENFSIERCRIFETSPSVNAKGKIDSMSSSASKTKTASTTTNKRKPVVSPSQSLARSPAVSSSSAFSSSIVKSNDDKATPKRFYGGKRPSLFYDDNDDESLNVLDSLSSKFSSSTVIVVLLNFITRLM